MGTEDLEKFLCLHFPWKADDPTPQGCKVRTLLFEDLTTDYISVL